MADVAARNMLGVFNDLVHFFEGTLEVVLSHSGPLLLRGVEGLAKGIIDGHIESPGSARGGCFRIGLSRGSRLGPSQRGVLILRLGFRLAGNIILMMYGRRSIDGCLVLLRHELVLNRRRHFVRRLFEGAQEALGMDLLHIHDDDPGPELCFRVFNGLFFCLSLIFFNCHRTPLSFRRIQSGCWVQFRCRKSQSDHRCSQPPAA